MVTKSIPKNTKPQIEESWHGMLSKEFEQTYFKSLNNQVFNERRAFEVFPPSELTYAAFNKTPFNKVKAVIIGQDPYHGSNQANGLCFSVADGTKHPPSLTNIFNELSNDLGHNYPKSGNLEPWANQGVLLLNSSLTVRKGEPNSHQKFGWQKFTDSVIRELSSNRTDIVFLLWGGFAQRKGAKIDTSKHLVLTSGHPSPLSANRGLWYGHQHFSKTNAFLKSIGKEPINWQIL